MLGTEGALQTEAPSTVTRTVWADAARPAATTSNMARTKR